jgi:hypothetical protein
VSQQIYEITAILIGILRTIVQIGILFGIWKVVFPGKSEKKLYGLFGLLLIVNMAAEFLTEHACYGKIGIILFIGSEYCWDYFYLYGNRFINRKTGK